ncbi:MAG: hypothetical protein IJX98_04680 [Clostridia bacterium]|nr:hypothetical protein [Clostridia bacterium]
MKKLRKKLTVALLGAACVCCVAAGAAASYGYCRQAYLSALADAAVLDCETELKGEYEVGEVLSVPAGVITVAGQPLAAQAFVTLPDGNVSAAKSFTLQESGLYTVEYKVEYDGEIFGVQKQFVVLEPSYAVNGETSSIAYGSYERYPSVDGLCVDLAQGDTFSYNKAISLNGKTKSDKLFSLNITPYTVGVGDAQVMNFTFTDLYDVDNFVTVQVKMDLQTDYYGLGVYAPRVYVTANANGQSPTGLFKDAKNGTYEYKGEKYTVQRNNNSGTLVANVCFAGQNALSATEIVNYEDAGKEFGIAFDYEERAVYLYRAEDNASFLIADLDDENVFGEKNVWNGFTADEAFLSVSADRYVSEKFSFVFRSIHGDTLQNAVNDVAYSTTISVEDGGIDYPDATVGKSYPVYEATAYHIKQGALPVQTRVYFGYDTGARFELRVKDGRFTPVAEGVYTVEYTATDKFGDKTVKLIQIAAKNSDQDLTVSLSEAPAGSYVVGNEVPVAAPVYESAYAAYGLQSTITARLKNSSVAYEIGEDLVFRPLYAGEYEIVYVCEDFVETVEKKYTVTVGADGAPIVTDTIYTPDYVIKNAKTKFETVFGYLFENGNPVRTQAELTVEEYAEKDGAVEKTTSVSDEYTVGECKYIKLKYTVGETSVSSAYIPVVDVGFGGKIDMTQYFVATKGSFGVEKASGYLTFSTDKERSENGEVAFEFINRVLSNEFIFGFSGASSVAGDEGYGTFEILLTDYYDEAVALKFGYAPTDGGTDFYLNGEKKVSLAETSSNNTFSLTYDNASVSVRPQVGTSVAVYNDLSGAPFEGFPSGYVRVSFAFTGIEKESALRIKKIGNQTFDKTTSDYMKPMLYVVSEESSYTMGNVAKIPYAYCADILDPFVTLSFSVETPDGEIATSVDGVRLENVTDLDREYFFNIDSYGIYYVTYTATDTSGRSLPLTYSLTVPDTIPPTVRLTNKTVNAKTGDAVSVATAEINDNGSASENVKVFVSVLSPDGLLTVVSDGKFTANRKGNYTVYYHATDESGNTTIVSYVVTVE